MFRVPSFLFVAVVVTRAATVGTNGVVAIQHVTDRCFFLVPFSWRFARGAGMIGRESEPVRVAIVDFCVEFAVCFVRVFVLFVGVVGSGGGGRVSVASAGKGQGELFMACSENLFEAVPILLDAS